MSSSARTAGASSRLAIDSDPRISVAPTPTPHRFETANRRTIYPAADSQLLPHVVNTLDTIRTRLALMSHSRFERAHAAGCATRRRAVGAFSTYLGKDRAHA